MGAIAQLAEIIKFSRIDKNWNQRNVAQVAGCSEKLVAAWEEGTTVPDGQRWNKLCRALDRSLYQWNSLHKQALAELSVRDARPVATTNLGDKLRAAVAQAPLMLVQPKPEKVELVPAVLPEPAPLSHEDEAVEEELSEEEKRTRQKISATLLALPEGWKTAEAVAERERAAREMLRQRPRQPLAGPGGVMQQLRERFGVAVGRERLAEIRDEIQREILKKVIPEPTQMWDGEKGTLPPIEALGGGPLVLDEAVLPPLKPAPRNDAAEQLRAGIELLRDAIPGLAELLLTIDERGEVDVSYKVREVKIIETSGSLKIGGRKP